MRVDISYYGLIYVALFQPSNLFKHGIVQLPVSRQHLAARRPQLVLAVIVADRAERRNKLKCESSHIARRIKWNHANIAHAPIGHRMLFRLYVNRAEKLHLSVNIQCRKPAKIAKIQY